MTDKLQQKLASLPTKPGVYLHKDAKGKILYVGKAKNLRNRVRSYFRQQKNQKPKTKILVSKIADIDIIIARSEVEALLVESNFIKQYRPPYNVVLRDDKQYLFVKVTIGEKWPRVTTARRITDKARYFGPYTSSFAVRQTLKNLRKIFPYCLPNDPCDSQNRPCLYYQLGLCPSPQHGKISEEDYRRNIERIIRVLEGDIKEVRGQLTTRMNQLSREQDFEQAAKCRDKLAHLEAILSTQQAVDTKQSNRDVIGLARDEGQAVVVLITVRRGRVVARNEFTFWGSGESSNGEVIDSFLGQYYKTATNLPDEVLIPCDVDNARVVSVYLAERRGRKVPVEQPQRGSRRKLLDLAQTNAREHLKQLRQAWLEDERRTTGAVTELCEKLHLPKPPTRIECYDISTLTGTSTVGSMVVFTDGQPDKAHYRRFQIRHVKGIDDFSAMREVLSRRFRRLKKPATHAQGQTLSVDASFEALPDLIVIDGGKGQVSAAEAALRGCGATDIPLIGLAKRLEEIVIQHSPPMSSLAAGRGSFSANKKEGSSLRKDDNKGSFLVKTLPPDSQALYLLQRIRDEAHRFAITYNRNMRSRRGTRSALDELPGIGPVKKKQLIKVFGSVAKVRQADLPAIQAVVGKAAGRVIKENL